MIKTILGVATLLAGLVGAMVFASQPRENYTISPRGDVPVIEVTGAGAEPVISTTAIYGDDRLVQRRQHRYESSRSRDSTKSCQLTHEQTRALVDIAVDGGLVGMTWEHLEQKIRDRTGAKPVNIQYPGSLKIRYRLDALGASGESVDFTFECMCNPGVLKFHHEDVPEVVALNELMAKINEYAKGIE